jgi:hypothetical protein
MLVSALAAAGIAGVAIWTGGLHGTRTPTTIAAVVRVDLRPFALVRNEVQDPPQSKQVAATFSRQAIRLEISLPVGASTMCGSWTANCARSCRAARRRRSRTIS